MNKPLQVALIGCGRIAGHHCKAIDETNGVELAAVCDLAQDKARVYADQFDVTCFTNYHAMLTETSAIDIVAIITPSGAHFEHAMDIINRYEKHLIVEKPTFMRPEHLNTVYGAANKKQCAVLPVFQNRYNRAVQRVKQAVMNEELGEIRLISVCVRWCRPQRYYDLAPWRGTFSHDGGALTNQAIHHVDLLRYLGGDVSRVNAVMRTLGADIEVEDTVVATIEFESGAVGALEVTTAARPDDFEASINITGSKGLAKIGGIAVNELQIFTPDPSSCAANSEDFQGIEGHGAVYGYGHSEMYNDIVAFFRDETPYPIQHNDCLKTLKLLHAFYRSDETGTWALLEGDKQSNRLGRPDDNIAALYHSSLPELT